MERSSIDVVKNRNVPKNENVPVPNETNMAEKMGKAFFYVAVDNKSMHMFCVGKAVTIHTDEIAYSRNDCLFQGKD